MSASGRSPDGYPGRIDTVFPAVSPEPANGRLAIMNLGRPPGLPTQAIANGGSNDPAGSDQGGKPGGTVSVSLVTGPPRASVDPDDDGQGFAGRLYRQKQVKRLPRVFRAGISYFSDGLEVIGPNPSAPREKEAEKK